MAAASSAGEPGQRSVTLFTNDQEAYVGGSADDTADRIRWIRAAIQQMRDRGLRVQYHPVKEHSNAGQPIDRSYITDLRIGVGASPLLPILDPRTTLMSKPEPTDQDIPQHNPNPEAPISSAWAALASLDTARQELRQRMQGQRSVNDLSVLFAAIRPPGHHAFDRWARGFCFFNNGLLMAVRAIREENARVLVLDIDYHYGSGSEFGTQIINRAYWSAACGLNAEDQPIPASSRDWPINVEEAEPPLPEGINDERSVEAAQRNMYRDMCRIFAGHYAAAAAASWPSASSSSSSSSSSSRAPVNALPVTYVSYHIDSTQVYDSPKWAIDRSNPDEDYEDRRVLPPYMRLPDDVVARRIGVMRDDLRMWVRPPLAAAGAAPSSSSSAESESPLEVGARHLRRELQQWLAAGDPTQPHYIIVSAGFDASRSDKIGYYYNRYLTDPIGPGDLWTPEVYETIAFVLNEAWSAQPNVGLVSVLEGGYLEKTLKCNAVYSYIATLCLAQALGRRLYQTDAACSKPDSKPPGKRGRAQRTAKRPSRPSRPSDRTLSSPSAASASSPSPPTVDVRLQNQLKRQRQWENTQPSPLLLGSERMTRGQRAQLEVQLNASSSSSASSFASSAASSSAASSSSTSSSPSATLPSTSGSSLLAALMFDDEDLLPVSIAGASSSSSRRPPSPPTFRFQLPPLTGSSSSTSSLLRDVDADVEVLDEGYVPPVSAAAALPATTPPPIPSVVRTGGTRYALPQLAFTVADMIQADRRRMLVVHAARTPRPRSTVLGQVLAQNAHGYRVRWWSAVTPAGGRISRRSSYAPGWFDTARPNLIVFNHGEPAATAAAAPALVPVGPRFQPFVQDILPQWVAHVTDNGLYQNNHVSPQLYHLWMRQPEMDVIEVEAA